MTKIISFILLIISVAACTQSKLTSKDILNKELLYKFEGGNILMIIKSDSTLFWRNDTKPEEANEQSKTIHIDEHTIMTAWYESDSTFVTLLSDFNKLKVSETVCRADGKFYAIKGDIEVKK